MLTMFLNDEGGATAVEYAILAIMVTAIASVLGFLVMIGMALFKYITT
jgi:Flp pilus assembly pilin Flp